MQEETNRKKATLNVELENVMFESVLNSLGTIKEYAGGDSVFCKVGPRKYTVDALINEVTEKTDMGQKFVKWSFSSTENQDSLSEVVYKEKFIQFADSLDEEEKEALRKTLILMFVDTSTSDQEANPERKDIKQIIEENAFSFEFLYEIFTTMTEEMRIQSFWELLSRTSTTDIFEAK